MFAKIISIFMLVGASAASRSLVDVNPNSLSCDPEGKEFLLLPHYTDCSKFFMCANGVEVQFSCAAGTVFDFVLQVCNHASKVECILREEEVEDLEGSGSGDDEEHDWWPLREGELKNDNIDELVHLTGLVSESRLMPVEPAFVVNSVLDCRTADAASKQAPYVGDCQRYWRCINGVPQTVYCSDGLFFNKATQQCDFEGNAHCVDQIDDELQGEFIVY